MICGAKRPKYEWAHVIGQVAATHEYKSGKRMGGGEFRRQKREGRGNLEIPKNMDKVLACEVELKEYI